MKILRADSAKLTEATAVALGMFDGVHLGHKKIIEQARSYAVEHGLKTAVVTLANHPRGLTQGRAPSLLTDLNARLALFARMEIDYVLVLDFTPDLMHTSALDYLQKYLLNILNVKFISIGYDHHFGRGREGSPRMLADWCMAHSCELSVLEAYSSDNYLVSSSVIRDLVKEGDIVRANKLLGHEYFLLGEVVHGDGRGNRIGYPTANLKLPPVICLPSRGVYAAELVIHDKSDQEFCFIKQPDFDSNEIDQDCYMVLPNLDKQRHRALVNIGTRPTFKDDDQLSVEAHILDFDQDLYGKVIELCFVDKIREEKKFASKEELIAQIEEDKKYHYAT